MNTEFPYDKGGNTLTEVIDNIFDNLKHKHEDSGEEVVTLARSGFKEICEHIDEWQSMNTSPDRASSTGMPISNESSSRFIYTAGTDPVFSVGDVVASYDISTDHEGEIVYGTVKEIKYNEEIDDWIYTFEEDSITANEQYLIEEDAYAKCVGEMRKN